MARAALASDEHLSDGASRATNDNFLTCWPHLLIIIRFASYRPVLLRLLGDYRPAAHATMRLSATKTLIPCVSLLLPSLSSAQCPLYQNYAAQYHEPFTQGTWNLSYARPIIPCRTFRSEEVESTIERLRGVVKDPDLFRVRNMAAVGENAS